MRQITAWLYLTLDGVVEAPENWAMYDEEIGEVMYADQDAADTLLLGRRTYELFAGSWPQRSSADDPNTDWMNHTPKLVASTTLRTLEWENSSLIPGDVTEYLAGVTQQPGKNLLVNGSICLVRSLLADRLLDRLRLFVHPVVLGKGDRLFRNDGDRLPLRLVEAHPFTNGVVGLTYQPAVT